MLLQRLKGRIRYDGSPFPKATKAFLFQFRAAAQIRHDQGVDGVITRKVTCHDMGARILQILHVVLRREREISLGRAVQIIGQFSGVNELEDLRI